MTEKRKKFKRKVIFKTIQIATILIIAIIISFIFIKKITKTTQDLTNKEESVQSVELQNKSRITMIEEYKQAKPYLDKVKAINFLSEDLVGVLSSLEEAAKDTNNKYDIKSNETITVKDINITGSEVKKMSYTITLTGNYNSFLNYLKKIKELPYLIKIDNIDMQGGIDLDKDSQTIIGASFFIEKTR